VKIGDSLKCDGFSCNDMRHDCFVVPDVDIDLAGVKVVLVSEAAPSKREDFYYAGEGALFAQTTVQAFRDAGIKVSSVRDILGLGVYLTTAVKCGKTGYAILPSTVQECSMVLEKELALFPSVEVYLLMGDVAIKAINSIAQRAGEPRVIPAGSTYKIRSGQYFFRGARAFPSYLQAGPSFFIEKSKRRMIAEDIAAAMKLVRQ
jgi:uracil-DNA glycosylase